MRKFEHTLNGIRRLGFTTSVCYMATAGRIGWMLYFKERPQNRALETAVLIVSIVGLIISLHACFPDRMIYLIDENECESFLQEAAKKLPLMQTAVMPWTDGKALVVRTYAFGTLLVSMAVLIPVTVIFAFVVG